MKDISKIISFIFYFHVIGTLVDAEVIQVPIQQYSLYKNKTL